MSDQQPTNPGDANANRSLSEISHLFLSSVRDKQMGSSPRPQRTPPKPMSSESSAPAPSLDLTPEELAQVIGGEPIEQRKLRELSIDKALNVCAVIAPHLNGHQRDRVREYAAHLCKSGERVGLIEIDACEFRLSSFELGTSEPAAEPHACDMLDSRMIAEAIEEMSWDVDRWIINVPNPRLAEARPLLRALPRWTVLATCDHDGVVSCYRSLKGLADQHRPDSLATDEQTVLSLALLDAGCDEMHAMRIFRKLAGVCHQFLHWPLESEPAVCAAGSVSEHQVLVCRTTRDKAAVATAPQWQIVTDFIARRSNENRGESAAELPHAIDLDTIPTSAPAAPAIVLPSAPTMTIAPTDINEEASDMFTDVIDLPAGAESAAAIVSATVRGGTELVECPVKPPMLEDARLAVARDRRLVMLAVAKQGLSDLRLIGEAWRWMNENRQLIAMAMPQLSIDPHQMPSLRLLIDRADLSATTLQPLLQTGNVTVQTYRKLRWGAKTGLLLEAA